MPGHGVQHGEWHETRRASLERVGVPPLSRLLSRWESMRGDVSVRSLIDSLPSISTLQYAPDDRTTAVMVRKRITKSKLRDQFST